MFKATIEIELEGSELESLKGVSQQVYGLLNNLLFDREVESCVMSETYEEDGEYVDSDETEIELGNKYRE